MIKKLNGAFLREYIELDKVCCLKFGTVTGGVTEYINRLITARFAPGRDDVLPRLVNYRNIRNRMAHEAGALGKIDGLNKADIKWISSFKRDLEKRKDPISLYLRKSRRFARRRKARNALIWLSIILLVLGVGAYFIITKLLGL